MKFGERGLSGALVVVGEEVVPHGEQAWHASGDVELGHHAVVLVGEHMAVEHVGPMVVPEMDDDPRSTERYREFRRISFFEEI